MRFLNIDMARARGLGASVLAAAFAGVPVVAYAQLGAAPMPRIAPQQKAQPTLEETLKWVEETLRGWGPVRSPSRPRDIQYRFKWSNGCQVEILVIQRKVPEGTVSGDAYRFNLADIEPDMITVGKEDNTGRLFTLGRLEKKIKIYATTEYFTGEFGDKFARFDADAWEKVVGLVEMGVNGYKLLESDSYELEAVPDPSYAIRFANAMRHGAKLCGQRRADEMRRKATPSPGQPF